MDSQRLHLRSTAIVDQALLNLAPAITADFELEVAIPPELRIVANTIVVADAVVRGYHLKLIADAIVAADPQATITVGLADEVAPDLFNGRAGHPLTVVAARLNGGSGQAVGQQGGKGEKGLDGVEIGSPLPDHDPNEPFPQPGPPLQEGRDGGKGGPGMKGGDGGPVTLILREPSAAVPRWFGKGGAKGEGGNGGLGEEVFGELDGEDGPPGDPGTLGDDKPAAVQIVDLEGFRQGVAQALALGAWAGFRQALAVEEFQRGNFGVALDERDAAIALAGAPQNLPLSMGSELPALVRDQRTITGVARDQDLVPDIDHHAAAYTSAAQALIAKIVAGNGFLPGILIADPRDRLTQINAALQTLVGPTGDLATQRDDLRGRADKALTTINTLRQRTTSALERLDQLLAQPGVAPTITPAGPGAAALQASDIGQRLAELLGAKDTSAAATPASGTVLIPEPAGGAPFRPELDPTTLLPADLELLVHRSVRDRRIVTPEQATLMAARASGLAQIAQWGSVAANAVSADGVPAAVHLGRVAQDLRSAAGHRGVLDALIELAEIGHGWRLARARMEQLLAGAKTVAHRLLVANAALGQFFPQSPLAVEPAPLLPGLRCLLDALAWWAEQADRAADLLTFGLTRAPAAELSRFPQRPALEGDITRLAPLMYAPDWEHELRDTWSRGVGQCVGAGRPESECVLEPHAADDRLYYDVIMFALMARQPRALVDAYLQRGIPLVGVAPPPVERIFRREERPDLFERFEAKGNFWFDIGLAEIAGPAGTVPHKETRVVGLKITLEFDGEAPASDPVLLATHTGLSVQRDLDGTVHRQQMLPEQVALTLSVPTVEGARASQLLQGEVNVDPTKRIDFKVYGRGAAAGWLIAKADSQAELPGLKTIIVEVRYEGIVPAGTVSLRSVSSAPAALRVGAELPVTVCLTAPAGAGGQPVLLASSDASVITTPAAIVVAEGHSEATGFLKVVGATGGLPPTITARTADGVARSVRPIVPKPPRPLTANVTLMPGAGKPSVPAVAILPGRGGLPGNVLTTCGLPPGENGTPAAPLGFVEVRGADLAPIRQATVGHGPRSVAVDAARGTIYVSNGGAGSTSVSMLDAKTLQTRAEQTVGTIIDLVVDSAAGLVYASRHNPGEIVVLSAEDLRIVEKIGVDDSRMRRPHGMALVPGPGPREAVLYVARTARGIPDEESAVTQIVRAADGSHRIEQSLRFADVGTQPVDVAVDPVHKLVFVSGLGGGGIPPELIVLEHPTMAERGRVRLLAGGRAVASRPGSGLAYVVGEAGLTIIDGRSLAMVSRITFPGGVPLAIAVDPASGTAYVGHRDDARLTRIDAPTTATPAFW